MTIFFLLLKIKQISFGVPAPELQRHVPLPGRRHSRGARPSSGLLLRMPFDTATEGGGQSGVLSICGPSILPLQDAFWLHREPPWAHALQPSCRWLPPSAPHRPAPPPSGVDLPPSPPSRSSLGGRALDKMMARSETKRLAAGRGAWPLGEARGGGRRGVEASLPPARSQAYLWHRLSCPGPPPPTRSPDHSGTRMCSARHPHPKE